MQFVIRLILAATLVVLTLVVVMVMGSKFTWLSAFCLISAPVSAIQLV